MHFSSSLPRLGTGTAAIGCGEDEVLIIFIFYFLIYFLFIFLHFLTLILQLGGKNLPPAQSFRCNSRTARN
jgi:hypothetical protein